MDVAINFSDNTVEKNSVTISAVKIHDYKTFIRVLRSTLDAGKAAWPNEMTDYVLVNKFQGREEGADRKL